MDRPSGESKNRIHMEHVTGRNLKGGNTAHERGGGREDGKGRVLRQTEKRAAEEEKGVKQAYRFPQCPGTTSSISLPLPSRNRGNNRITHTSQLNSQLH